MVQLNELKIGDSVRYKKNGRSGSYEAEVTGIGLAKVGIKIISHMGVPLPAGPAYRNVSPKSLWLEADEVSR
jgi:hypothetical protein